MYLNVFCLTAERRHLKIIESSFAVSRQNKLFNSVYEEKKFYRNHSAHFYLLKAKERKRRYIRNLY